MTREEFEGWKALTARSKERWMMDLIQYSNHGTYLFFKGGENGTFVMVDKNGTAECGTYEGALPHIGEAAFKIISEKKYATQQEALRNIYRVLPELRAACCK